MSFCDMGYFSHSICLVVYCFYDLFETTISQPFPSKSVCETTIKISLYMLAFEFSDLILKYNFFYIAQVSVLYLFC